MKPGRHSRFDELPGWNADDHAAALACLRVSARHHMVSEPWNSALSQVLDKSVKTKSATPSAAREFFEHNFRPERLSPNSGNAGFVTGYYEPVIPASREETTRYRFPLYRRPSELSSATQYSDRSAIRQGALSGRDLELAWLDNPVDQFFIHVQGSARLELVSGESIRVGFAAKNGHPYTAIGKILADRGHLARDAVTMDSIRQWLTKNPELADSVMDQNRSYIFFREIAPENPDLGPVGSASVQLTPGRSIAVDPAHTAFGLPVWIATREPLPHESLPFRRLMIAQDSGSAIKGPARGDLFIGTGDEAGSVAGAIQHAADFFMLQPIADGTR